MIQLKENSSKAAANYAPTIADLPTEFHTITDNYKLYITYRRRRRRYCVTTDRHDDVIYMYLYGTHHTHFPA